METATQITTIAFLMVVPCLLGYWLDSYLGTLPLFVMLGLAVGIPGGIWQLIRLVNRKPGAHPERESNRRRQRD